MSIRNFNYNDINKLILLFSFLFIPLNLYSIKFKIQDKNGKERIIQAIFDTGFSAKAVTDGIGITDYESTFIKTAFHYEDFGFAYNFDFRFNLFSGHGISFKTTDWYVPKDSMLNSELNTFFLYLDKIIYIKYGDLNSPIFFNIGKNPVITFGSGFLVNNFHNHSFLPIAKEQGFVFKFDGKKLDKLNLNNFPLDLTFLVTDLLDPDIFAFDIGVDIFDFTNYKDKFDLRIGYSAATDINATESNRLSSRKIDKVTSHRNLSTTNYNIVTSFPFFNDINVYFTWPYKYVKSEVTYDYGFLIDFNNNYDSPKFGFGMKLAAEEKFINIKNHGYLLGIFAGFIVRSPHYTIDYFSSNYEILRQKQYLAMKDNEYYYFYITAGLGLYAFNEKLKFQFKVTIPLINQFTARLSAKFIIEDIVPGLYCVTYYETGLNAMYAYGNGGGFLDSITRDFRFSFEGGYKFYGAKLGVIIGVQRPSWVIPAVNESDTYPRNPYKYLAEGRVVPNQYTSSSSFSLYNWDMDTGTYGRDIQKFVSLEISFEI